MRKHDYVYLGVERKGYTFVESLGVCWSRNSWTIKKRASIIYPFFFCVIRIRSIVSYFFSMSSSSSCVAAMCLKRRSVGFLIAPEGVSVPLDQVLSGLQKAIRGGLIEYVPFFADIVCAVLSVEWALPSALSVRPNSAVGMAAVAEEPEVVVVDAEDEDEDEEAATAPVATSGRSVQTQAKAVLTNILHRLLVIWLEDCHPGAPLLWARVSQLAEGLLGPQRRVASASGLPAFRAAFEQLCELLCSCGHSRLYSYLGCAIKHRRPFPEAFQCAFRAVEARYSKEKPRVPEGFSISGVNLGFWLRELPPREKWLLPVAVILHRPLRALISDAGSLVGSKLLPGEIVISKGDRSSPWSQGAWVEFLGSPLVCDIHTASGRASGEGVLRFAFGGACVVNDRSHLLVPPEFEAGYINEKVGLPQDSVSFDALVARIPRSLLVCKVLHEATLIQFCVRCQLVCSGCRPDTYLGQLWGRPVFVKGPFPVKGEEKVDHQLWLAELKAALGLPVLRPLVLWLHPSQFEWESPLGSRNDERVGPGRFLIFESVAPQASSWEVPIVIKKSSVKWPDTPVVASVPEDLVPAEWSPEELLEGVLAYLWRFVANIPDAALRNLLRRKGRVFSVDEDNPFRADFAPSPLRISEAQRWPFVQLIKDEFETVLKPQLVRWKAIIQLTIKEKAYPVDISGAVQRLDLLLSSPAEVLRIFEGSGGKGKRGRKEEIEEEGEEGGGEMAEVGVVSCGSNNSSSCCVKKVRRL
ncbi:hypothetical protein FJZ55_01275 [Candidatus Woesearchaeota archaeon]|nr:hypothetical protein [Candidatus Woesearchaeota archaeon]